MGSFDSALLMLKTSYAWFSERGFLRQSQWDTRLIGDIYLSMGKLPQAENFYRLSETLLNEMIERGSIYRHDSLKYTVSFGYELYLPVNKNDMKEGIYLQAVELYRNMYELYYQEGRLSESIKYLANYADTKDTLRAIQSNRESIEIQTKYETEGDAIEANEMVHDRVGGHDHSDHFAGSDPDQAKPLEGGAREAYYPAEAAAFSNEPALPFQFSHQHTELHDTGEG